MIGVAVDVQGAAAAAPWYGKHELSYPTLVDAANNLGRAVGYKIIPNQFYVDELGVFQGNIDEDQLQRKLSLPLRALPPDVVLQMRAAGAGSETFVQHGDGRDDFASELAAGRAALAGGRVAEAITHLTRAAKLKTDSTDALTTLAVAHLAAGDKVEAAKILRKALARDPENWLIRKQIWAVEHPERFYKGAVDFAWQRQQLRRERGGG